METITVVINSAIPVIEIIEELNTVEVKQGIPSTIEVNMSAPGTPGAKGDDGLTVSVNDVEQIDGNISLDLEDIPETDTEKKMTADERTKLEGLENYDDTAVNDAIADKLGKDRTEQLDVVYKPSADCNTVTEEWHYGGGAGATHYPTSGNTAWYCVNTIFPTTADFRQIAYGVSSITNGSIFTRRWAVGTGYTAWVQIATTADITTAITDKVDKADGYGLSENDFTNTLKTKLAGIAESANNYTHPDNHPPSIITQDTGNRFVTDTEKAAWTADIITSIAGRSKNIISAKPTWITTLQSGHGWTNPVGGGTTNLTNDTSDYIYGTQCLKITEDGVAQKSGFALDLTGKAIVIKFKVNAIAAGGKLTLYAAQTSALAAYKTWDIFNESYPAKLFQVGEWVKLVLPWETSTTTVGSPTKNSIDTFRIRGLTGTGGNIIQIQAIGTTPIPSKGTVTVTFDDGYSSNINGAKILAKYGIPGTAFVIPDKVGNAGFMTLSEIRTLQDTYDWDIEAHGGDDLTTFTEQQMKDLFIMAKKYFKTNGLGAADHFAYPNGQSNALVVATVKNYFSSSRTITYGTTLEAYPPAMPYRLRAISGCGSGSGGTPVTTIQSAITNAANSGEWVILVFHKIVSATPASAMECQDTELETISASIIASGCNIKTINEMLI